MIQAALNGIRILQCRLAEHRFAKHPLTQARRAALTTPRQVNDAPGHDFLGGTIVIEFSASHTSSNAADMALIWCGSKTLSRKRIPSGKNATIEPVYRHPFSSSPKVNRTSRL